MALRCIVIVFVVLMYVPVPPSLCSSLFSQEGSSFDRLCSERRTGKGTAYRRCWIYCTGSNSFAGIEKIRLIRIEPTVRLTVIQLHRRTIPKFIETLSAFNSPSCRLYIVFAAFALVGSVSAQQESFSECSSMSTRETHGGVVAMVFVALGLPIHKLMNSSYSYSFISSLINS